VARSFHKCSHRPTSPVRGEKGGGGEASSQELADWLAVQSVSPIPMPPSHGGLQGGEGGGFLPASAETATAWKGSEHPAPIVFFLKIHMNFSSYFLIYSS